jgi:hypothetical protein
MRGDTFGLAMPILKTFVDCVDRSQFYVSDFPAAVSSVAASDERRSAGME